jgi:hypothetical protein
VRTREDRTEKADFISGTPKHQPVGEDVEHRRLFSLVQRDTLNSSLFGRVIRGVVRLPSVSLRDPQDLLSPKIGSWILTYYIALLRLRVSFFVDTRALRVAISSF